MELDESGYDETTMGEKMVDMFERTCNGCYLKKCNERFDNLGCDWKVDKYKLADILSDYTDEGLKAAYALLKDGGKLW